MYFLYKVSPQIVGRDYTLRAATQKWQEYQLNAGGQFSFNSAATGNGFADFLMGFAASYSEPASVNFVHL